MARSESVPAFVRLARTAEIATLGTLRIGDRRRVSGHEQHCGTLGLNDAHALPVRSHALRALQAFGLDLVVAAADRAEAVRQDQTSARTQIRHPSNGFGLGTRVAVPTRQSRPASGEVRRAGTERQRQGRAGLCQLLQMAVRERPRVQSSLAAPSSFPTSDFEPSAHKTFGFARRSRLHARRAMLRELCPHRGSRRFPCFS